MSSKMKYTLPAATQIDSSGGNRDAKAERRNLPRTTASSGGGCFHRL